MKKILTIILSVICVYANGQLLFSSNFANNDLTQGNKLSLAQACLNINPNAVNFVDSFGRKAICTKVNKTDALCISSHRAELMFPFDEAIMPLAKWFQIKFYMPSWQLFGLDGCTIMQFPSGAVGDIQPMWEVQTQYGNLYFLQAYDDNGDSVQTKKTFNLGMIPKDQWLDMVVYYNAAKDNTGLLKVYLNGVKVVDEVGSNSELPAIDNLNRTHNNGYFKFGTYAHGLKYNYAISPTKETLFSEVNVWGAATTIDDILVVKPTTPINSIKIPFKIISN